MKDIKRLFFWLKNSKKLNYKIKNKLVIILNDNFVVGVVTVLIWGPWNELKWSSVFV